MKKIILLKGQTETLEFFSKRLNIYLKKYGYETFIYDISLGDEQIEALEEYTEIGNTVFITYNFNGISGEKIFLDAKGRLFFDEFYIECINIVVDHPMYYYKYYNSLPRMYRQINIDRTHREYMREYYKECDADYFIPLCGTRLKRELMPMRYKKTDVIFTGNFTPCNTFDKYITRIDKEYEDFYRGIIDDLISNNEKTMEQAFNEHLIREGIDVDNNELKRLHSNMTFIDLYVRFYYREKVIGTIADSGIKINTYGAGYELLKCKKHENIIRHGGVNTKGCIDAIYDAKISLNVMPWFKDGAHDRVYTSMLNAAVSLTDTSRYLAEEYTDGEDICFYNLAHIEQAVEWINRLLSDEELLERIAASGCEKTEKTHTFDNVTKELISVINKR